MTVAAPPTRVWSVLVQPSRWWNAAHTYSGDAARLSLEPRAGGCFCERLRGGGGVEHLRVVYAASGEELRLAGALGPLQTEGLVGAMTIGLKPVAGGTEVTLRYVVGGYRPGGFQAIAGPVDQVLGEQLTRLAAALR